MPQHYGDRNTSLASEFTEMVPAQATVFISEISTWSADRSLLRATTAALLRRLRRNSLEAWVCA